jgi:hypothetical protein
MHGTFWLNKQLLAFLKNFAARGWLAGWLVGWLVGWLGG